METATFVTLEDLANFSSVEQWQALHGAGQSRGWSLPPSAAAPTASVSQDSYEIACSPPALGESFLPLSKMMSLETGLAASLGDAASPGRDDPRDRRDAAANDSSDLVLEEAPRFEEEDIFELEL